MCYKKTLGLGYLFDSLRGKNRVFQSIKTNRVKDLWFQPMGFLIKDHPFILLRALGIL